MFAVIAPLIIQLVEAALPIGQEIWAAYHTELAAKKANVPLTADEQAEVNSAAASAHAALQGVAVVS